MFDLRNNSNTNKFKMGIVVHLLQKEISILEFISYVNSVQSSLKKMLNAEKIIRTIQTVTSAHIICCLNPRMLGMQKFLVRSMVWYHIMHLETDQDLAQMKKDTQKRMYLFRYVCFLLWVCFFGSKHGLCVDPTYHTRLSICLFLNKITA